MPECQKLKCRLDPPVDTSALRRVNKAAGDSCEDVWSAHEDDDASDDVEDDEHPEAETIDHHGDELPVAGRAAFFGVVFQFAGDPAQFVEYRQQLCAHCTQRCCQYDRGRRAVWARSSDRVVRHSRRILCRQTTTVKPNLPTTKPIKRLLFTAVYVGYTSVSLIRRQPLPSMFIRQNVTEHDRDRMNTNKQTKATTSLYAL